MVDLYYQGKKVPKRKVTNAERKKLKPFINQLNKFINRPHPYGNSSYYPKKKR